MSDATSSGIETATISTSRSLGSGDITIDCTVDEQGVDTLTITEHPVERGADTSDHFYRNPARFLLHASWSNSSPYAGGSEGYIQDIYQQLIALQTSGALLTVYTSKRMYQNMLIESISQTTDEETYTTLSTTITLRELIIVNTQATTLPPTNVQANAANTGTPTSAGRVQPIPSAVTPVASNPATQEVTT